MMRFRDGLDAVTINSPDGSTSATFIPAHGGLGSSLILPIQGVSREILFMRPTFWTTQEDTGGWPFLFPVCGRHLWNGQRGLYQWGGNTHEMPLHGFAMRKPWTLENVAGDRLSMFLLHDEDTLRNYPFEFYVKLMYVVTRGCLTCYQLYENRGDMPMPFYAGFHPYFTADILAEPWTLAGSFERVGTYNDGYTAVKEWKPANKTLDASAAASVQNIIELNSFNPITLALRGNGVLCIRANDPADDIPFPFLQLFRSGQDPFLCVEPWMGFPNGLNEPERIPVIPPGESRRATLSVSV